MFTQPININARKIPTITQSMLPIMSLRFANFYLLPVLNKLLKISL